MESLNTARVAEQIDLDKAPEVEPSSHTSAPRCGDAKAKRASSVPTGSAIRLRTMPYPASGPGGPSLTSRRH